MARTTDVGRAGHRVLFGRNQDGSVTLTAYDRGSVSHMWAFFPIQLIRRKAGLPHRRVYQWDQIFWPIPNSAFGYFQAKIRKPHALELRVIPEGDSTIKPRTARIFPVKMMLAKELGLRFD